MRVGADLPMTFLTLIGEPGKIATGVASPGNWVDSTLKLKGDKACLLSCSGESVRHIADVTLTLGVACAAP